jgi:hypothetical protein
MRFVAQRVRRNVREAETEDLLDRATVFRAGMEPEALEIIEAELRRRGIRADEIDAHAAARTTQPALIGKDGLPTQCSFCIRPAVAKGWRWAWGWGWFLPVLRPHHFYYCAFHQPHQGRRHSTPMPLNEGNP